MHTRPISNQSTLQRLPLWADVHQTGSHWGDNPSVKGLRNIVVPLDGTPFAEHAIPLALSIAERYGAALHLIHVFVSKDELDPYVALYAADESFQSLKERKRTYLNKIVQRVSKRTAAGVIGRITPAHSVPQALRSLNDANADLVVMATHGRSLLGRIWWGDVTHKYLNNTTVPTILVRGTDERPKWIARRLSRILLPVSHEPTSARIVDSVIERDWFDTAEHTLLHIVPREPRYVIRGGALRTDLIPSHRLWTAGMRYLQPLAEKLRKDGRYGVTKVISSDEPIGRTILQTAKKEKSDLITMMYERRGTFSRTLWPGVTDYLIRHSDRPLLLIPQE